MSSEDIERELKAASEAYEELPKGLDKQMSEDDVCKREQESAAKSYRNIPAGMLRIEQKLRRSSEQPRQAPRVFLISVWSSGAYFYGRNLSVAATRELAEQRIIKYQRQPAYENCNFTIQVFKVIV